MDQIDAAPIANETPGTDTSPPHSPIPELNDSSLTNTINYLLALITFLLGILLGYFLLRSLTVQSVGVPKKEVVRSGEIGLPVDAIQIQACADKKGSLYVRSEDIPVGPVYMVHEGKVIGIEFMLEQETFLSGKSYQQLTGLNIEVDHVNIGLLSQGHEGYTRPHYHVDIYQVSKEVVEGIKCPKTSAPSPTASESGSPAPITAKKEATIPGLLVSPSVDLY